MKATLKGITKTFVLTSLFSLSFLAKPAHAGLFDGLINQIPGVGKAKEVAGQVNNAASQAKGTVETINQAANPRPNALPPNPIKESPAELKQIGQEALAEHRATPTTNSSQETYGPVDTRPAPAKEPYGPVDTRDHSQAQSDRSQDFADQGAHEQNSSSQAYEGRKTELDGDEENTANSSNNGGGAKSCDSYDSKTLKTGCKTNTVSISSGGGLGNLLKGLTGGNPIVAKILEVGKDVVTGKLKPEDLGKKLASSVVDIAGANAAKESFGTGVLVSSATGATKAAINGQNIANGALNGATGAVKAEAGKLLPQTPSEIKQVETIAKNSAQLEQLAQNEASNAFAKLK